MNFTEPSLYETKTSNLSLNSEKCSNVPYNIERSEYRY